MCKGLGKKVTTGACLVRTEDIESTQVQAGLNQGLDWFETLHGIVLEEIARVDESSLADEVHCLTGYIHSSGLGHVPSRPVVICVCCGTPERGEPMGRSAERRVHRNTGKNQANCDRDDIKKCVQRQFWCDTCLFIRVSVSYPQPFPSCHGNHAFWLRLQLPFFEISALREDLLDYATCSPYETWGLDRTTQTSDHFINLRIDYEKAISLFLITHLDNTDNGTHGIPWNEQHKHLMDWGNYLLKKTNIATAEAVLPYPKTQYDSPLLAS